ncbi:MAG: hypothetical protein Q4G25_16470, partial [Paracoccus sp. (in: a-proteobacteria)]|nr:hypothetical protein [Paracoccus sp. (in: a-proteobacteria)]
MNAARDQAFNTKLQELMGERGSKPNHAVRFRDLRDAMGGSGLLAQVQKAAEKVARDIAESYDGANVDLSTLQDRINAAEAEAIAASAAAQNALSAAQVAAAYTDQEVAEAKAALGIDYASAHAAAASAQTWADEASQAVLRAQADVARLFPTDFRSGGIYWRSAYAGDPALAPVWTADRSFMNDPVAGDFIRIAADLTQTRAIVSRGTAPFVEGKTIRVTVKVRTNGGVTNRLQLAICGLRADWTNAQVYGSATFAPDAPDTFQTISRDFTLPAPPAGVVAFRAGVRAISSVTPALAIDVAEIRIEDVTALAGAEKAAADAIIARNDAVAAKDSAEGASAAASSYLGMAAQVASTGNGVLDDQFLAAPVWFNWGSGGTGTWRTNQFYPIGRSYSMSLADGEERGVRVDNAIAAGIWKGQANAAGYVVEVELTRTGSTAGAGVRLSWISGGASYHTPIALSAMLAGGGMTGTRQTARAVFMRPSGVTGSFSDHSIYIFAGHSMFGATAAKSVTIHRVNIRPATAEEMGSGQVMDAVQAHLTQNYLTKAGTNQSIAAAVQTVNASLGQTNAAVAVNSTALSSLDGAVARFSVVTDVNGGKQAAGLEI